MSLIALIQPDPEMVKVLDKLGLARLNKKMCLHLALNGNGSLALLQKQLVDSSGIDSTHLKLTTVDDVEVTAGSLQDALVPLKGLPKADQLASLVKLAMIGEHEAGTLEDPIVFGVSVSHGAALLRQAAATAKAQQLERKRKALKGQSKAGTETTPAAGGTITATDLLGKDKLDEFKKTVRK
jgi:hypothetical protein